MTYIKEEEKEGRNASVCLIITGPETEQREIWRMKEYQWMKE